MITCPVRRAWFVEGQGDAIRNSRDIPNLLPRSLNNVLTERITPRIHVTREPARPSVKPVLNWANVCSRTQSGVFGEYSWFLIGRTFASQI